MFRHHPVSPASKQRLTLLPEQKKVNLGTIIKKIEKAYYTIYIKWLENITLSLIVLQARLVMNRWLKLLNN